MLYKYFTKSKEQGGIKVSTGYNKETVRVEVDLRASLKEDQIFKCQRLLIFKKYWSLNKKMGSLKNREFQLFNGTNIFVTYSISYESFKNRTGKKISVI